MDYCTYFEYLTIGAHIRTTCFSSKSSKGFLNLNASSSSLSSSSSAMMNFSHNAPRSHFDPDFLVHRIAADQNAQFVTHSFLPSGVVKSCLGFKTNRN